MKYRHKKISKSGSYSPPFISGFKSHFDNFKLSPPKGRAVSYTLIFEGTRQTRLIRNTQKKSLSKSKCPSLLLLETLISTSVLSRATLLRRHDKAAILRF